MPSSKPSIAELRAVCQPASLMGRRSAEHWAGRLYMRRVSLHVTRVLLDAPVSPNQLTVLMIVVGLGGAVALAWPGVVTALIAVVLVQCYLLLDCVDGEVARWRRTTSAAGVYLDRLGHYAVEAGLLVGLGVRAAGGPGATPDAWMVGGAIAGLLMLLSKAETDLVTVARAGAGLSLDVEADPQPRQRGLASLRDVVGRVQIHQLVGGVELSLAALLAAVADLLVGDGAVTRALLVLAVLLTVARAVMHPVMILSSRRLS